MKYTMTELKKLRKIKDKNIEDRIKFNILNFIYTIHLNEQDFIEESYDAEFFGELPMTFRKNEGQVMGLITATVNGEVRKYIFNDQGYELLEDLLENFIALE